MRQAMKVLVGGGGLVVVLALLGACDRSKDNGGDAGGNREARNHPAVRRATAFLEAVQYRDLERAWKLHIESTRGGIYCSSDAFAKVLERTREEKTERDCEEARKMGPARRAALDRDAELLVQILRFACEQPDGDCVDYARKVFETQMPRSSLWKHLGAYRIRQVKTGEREARIYVDLWKGDPSDGRVWHRTIEVRDREGAWYVTTGPGSPEKRRLPDEETVR